MTNSQLFTMAHQITRTKNIAYYGSYRAAFAHCLRNLTAHGRPVRGFQIIEPARVWA